MEDMQRAEIGRHIQQHIGPIHIVFSEFIFDELKIDICHVKSSLFRRYEVLVTCGMSALPMCVPDTIEAPRLAEIITVLPKGWPLQKNDFYDERNYWPIRLMKDLARYPTTAKTWLGFGHTMASAESEATLKPYAESTKQCAAILLPSMTLGEKAWEMKRSDGESVFFWTAVPIYAEELELKREKGADELMALFDKFKINDRINPARVCVV